MSTAIQLWALTKKQLQSWSWLKRLLMAIAVLTFSTSSFLFLTPPGTSIRMFLSDTVITTRHRDWAWIFVGAEQRDKMVRQVQAFYDSSAEEKQDFSMINVSGTNPIGPVRPDRTLDELVKVEDISGKYWVGKKLTVYDPTTIRVVTPYKPGEGEKISAMVKRTGAVAGVNGGGFIDPDGLGNGFAPIGLILSGTDIVYTDTEGHIPQLVVGFTDEGTLVIGKYSIVELQEMHVTEAVSFYPRVIANGKPLITEGDGGWGRGPRTAVGQKADGTVEFLVVDGRQTHSIGATLKELQDIMLEDGCINAGFLDGGASSELVYDGNLMTKPSSRYGERRLPSAFLVFDHPDDYVPDEPWNGVTKIDPGGRYDHPDYLREQAELKARQQADQKSNPPKPPATPVQKPETTPSKPANEKPQGGAITPNNDPKAPSKPTGGTTGGASGGTGSGATVPGTAPGTNGATGTGGTTGTAGSNGLPGTTSGAATGAGGQATSPGGNTGSSLPGAGTGTSGTGSVAPGSSGTTGAPSGSAGNVQPPAGNTGTGTTAPTGSTATLPTSGSQPPASSTPGGQSAPGGTTTTPSPVQTNPPASVPSSTVPSGNGGSTGTSAPSTTTPNTGTSSSTIQSNGTAPTIIQSAPVTGQK
ncbi:MAG: hypothetical protein K0R75_1360 [Paenibacillaceae bacterium]|nr:hypothetical protein [Paenibacillaceae bacterium]